MNIKEIIKEIKKLENYCSVFKATEKTFNKTKDFFGEMPEDLQEFYKVYNGGLFFGHDFACIDETQDGRTLEELNDSEFKEMCCIPENVIVFIDTGYGDYVGYDKENKNIVQVNPEEYEEDWLIYKTFTEFMQEFLDDSKKLIDEGCLDPLR